MKGYLSVSGGIIHLLIELTLHTAPTKSPETKLLLLLTDSSLQTLRAHPHPTSSLKCSGSLHLPLTHLPLCASLRVNILFSPSLFHTLLFTYSSIVGLYIHEGPIYPEELPRFPGIWIVPPRKDLSAASP